LAEGKGMAFGGCTYSIGTQNYPGNSVNDKRHFWDQYT
jgi:hypothetical protein